MAASRFVLSLALLALPVAAHAIERPQLAVTRATAPIRLDGVLDEADWARATPVTDFRLVEVREGEAPVESTWVRVLIDDTRIYFGIRCDNRKPGAVRASMAPRDQVIDQDHISIHLDTYRDLHRAYIFGVNPYGVQLDGILVGNDPDFNWDAVWDVETTRDAAGWTAEMAIPLRSLRFPSHGDGRWGLWIRRQIGKADEVCSYPLWSQKEPGDVMLQAADLTGLEGVTGGGALEVEPYVSSARSDSRAPLAPPSSTLSPWDHATSSQAGLDLKYALTATLTGNATLNPDYSQIEADALQIDVNQRYPLFYAEKRPFFLEGAEIFSTPIDLVYTRRIANPDAGGKLVGTLGKLRLGVIAVRDGGGGSLDGVGGVPITGDAREGYFGIGRATYDVGENSSVGVLLAAHTSEGAKERAILAVNQPGAETDGGDNLIAAFDTKLRLSHALFFTGQIATSRTHVDSANTATWTAPRQGHYSGLAYSGTLHWQDGIRDLSLIENQLDPDFRAETGFLQRVDTRRSQFAGSFIVRPENAWLRSWQPNFEGHVLHDHAGQIQEWEVNPWIDLNFQKQTGFSPGWVRSRERWLGREYDRDWIIVDAWNSQWQPLDLSLGYQAGDGISYGDSDSTSFLGWFETISFTGTARPSARLTSALTANRSRFSRRRGGDELYDVWVLGARTTWQFTRRLNARIYPQYDTGVRHFDADGLIGYVVHPGSVVYVGMNNGIDRFGGRTRVTARTLFFKVSYLFRP